MAVPRRPKTNKNPPILSHEFVIQNHADIVSCVAMVLAIGLMFQVSSPFSSLFITLQHNITIENATGPGTLPMVFYAYGLRDLFTVFFYMLICIVVHAVVQEYIFDKLNRRMHLSKIKHSKFNESGQLLVFYLASAIWGIDIIIRENYLANISSLWERYPHYMLPSWIKFFYIIQMAYWIHSYPELYFQKAKKDEIHSQIQYITIYLICITVAYLINLSRLTIVLLVLHYVVEFVFHASRLLYFAEKAELANAGFQLWNVLFVIVRLFTITLAVLTLWFGMSKSSVEVINFMEGNFNTRLVRINCLLAICLLQAWLMWKFITFHLRRMREHSETSLSPPNEKSLANKKVSSPKAATKKKKSKGGSEPASSEGEELLENGSARLRTPKRLR